MNIRMTMCLCLASLSFSVYATSSENWSQIQIDVWATVQARNAAWQNNDFETYLNIHHDNWYRYSMRTSKLLSKSDVAVFWDNAKVNERVIQIELQPIAIDVFGDETVAIAHYVLFETFEWIGDDFDRPVWRVIKKGETYQVPVRFSDVYVKEGDHWLYAGGYRELTCDIFSESKNVCMDRQDDQ